ncbi:3028_t:CDS:1 [Dentiscutata erythropus]|uniref:3028_t:CDS:1 n=1 Tax=Dentiscutata erythropus TaxID=1348616 RepID=A0A9N9E240_9GLOM|nr:3028_t:CDS:1 [Dentiscutata erythropus]
MPFYIYVIPRDNNHESRYIADECTVNHWYNSVLKLKRDNPGEGKFSIEKVSPEWYTLQTSGDVQSFIKSVHDNELKEYRSRSFWLLLDDSDGRNMPIIPRQTFLP